MCRVPHRRTDVAGRSAGPPRMRLVVRTRRGLRPHLGPAAAALRSDAVRSDRSSSFPSSMLDSIQFPPQSNQCEAVVCFSISLTAMTLLLPPLGRTDVPGRWGHCHPQTHNACAARRLPGRLAQPSDEREGAGQGPGGCARLFWGSELLEGQSIPAPAPTSYRSDHGVFWLNWGTRPRSSLWCIDCERSESDRSSRSAAPAPQPPGPPGPAC